MTNQNTGSRALIIWTVDGVEHDHVLSFYTDPDTGAAAALCSHVCCCKKREEKT